MDKASWWFLFPMKGLEVSLSDAPFVRPLFGDATLVPRSAVPSLAEDLAATAPDERRVSAEAELRLLLESPLLHGHYDCLVGVRRSSYDRSEHDRTLDWPALESARQRAHCIAAALSFARLIRYDAWSTYSLNEYAAISRRYVLAFTVDARGFSMQNGRAWPITSLPKADRQSESDILSILAEPQVRPLSAILTRQDDDRSASLRATIRAASLRLYRALHEPDETGQVLGAVTALEILLSDGEDFEQLASRIVTALGPEGASAFDLPSILRTRHTYVHRGRTPSSADRVGARATAAALSVLLLVSRLAETLPSRALIIALLDLHRAYVRASPIPTMDGSFAISKPPQLPVSAVFPFFRNMGPPRGA